MKENPRVVVIGLDGATWDLIKPWAEEGTLPTFNKLMNEGTWGILESLELPISSAAWTTITTGVNPGKHGIFDFSIRKRNSYEIRPVSSKDAKYPRLWDIIGIYGKKSYIIDVPLTYPPQKIHGCMLSGFPCPEDHNEFTYPPEFIDELREVIDRDVHFQSRISPHDEAKFLEEMFKITDYVEETIKYILREKNFDFLMTVFVGPDALGHTFFKYIDRNHPKYRDDKELSHAILNMYIRLDKILKSIIELLNGNDKLFLISDHGFSSVYYGVALNKWLMGKGYLHLKRNPGTIFREILFNLGLTYENIFKIIKKLRGVKKVQNYIYSDNDTSLVRKLIQRIVSSMMIGGNDIDWQATEAYSQGNFGQIYINLRGREPEGSVDIQKYDELVEVIISDLREFRYNGERVFDEIERGKDVYIGAFAKNGPDIICTHSKSKYIVSRFFEFGSTKTITVHPIWSGTHDRNGIFLAWDNNNDFAAGKRLKAKLCDITPTILHLFSIPIPKDMDGKPLMEIFSKDTEFAKARVGDEKRLKERTEEVIKRLKIKGVFGKI
jgi:predicted AlkP superfamily phosphohydrolase/phosphomutase